MTISANFPNVQPSLLLDFANSESLPPSVTFTRATTATYYDGGTSALAEQNLLPYSQTFDSSVWQYGATTATSGQTAPDGTSTAIKIAANSTSTQHYLGILGTLPPLNVLSLYAKAAGVTSVRIDTNTSLETALFDLNSGTVTSVTGTGVTASITSVGSGWYRCVLVGVSLRNSFQIWPGGNQGSYSGNGTDGIIVWGAQAERRNAATAYTPTTTQPITNYIPVLLTAGGGQPRFDHNPTTRESLGLLIEQQSTNVVTNSASFSNWTKPNSSFSTEAIAPDGTLTGQKVLSTTTGSNSGAYQSSSGATTISMYAKAAGKNWVAFINTSGSTFVAWFNVSTGTVGTVSAGYTATMTSVGNGWYRCVLTAASGSFSYHQWCICDQDNDTAVTANAINGVFVWGAQAEASLFATSYIPTVTQATTRAEDGASLTNINSSSWFNNAQGTLYIDGARFGTNLYPRFAGFYSGNTENYSMGIGQWSASTVSFYGVNYTNQFDISRAPSGLAYGSQVRAAGAYAANNVGLSVNGTATSVDTDATIPFIDILWIGGGVNPRLNGWVKKVAYYPVRVTDAQLQALTT